MTTAVLDQGLVSAGTFLLHILLARLTLPADYGVFVLAFSVLTISIDLQSATILEPMMVFGPGKEDAVRHRYLGTVLSQQIVLTIALLLLMIGGGFAWRGIFGPGSAWATIAMAGFDILGVHGREFSRKVHFTLLNPRGALQTDLVYFSVLLGGLVVAATRGQLTGVTAFAILAVAGTVSAVAVIVRIRIPLATGFRELQEAAREHWSYARWMMVVSGARWASHDIYFFVAAIFVGPAGTGALKAVQNIFAPIAVFLVGLGSIIIPGASRLAATGPIRDLNRFVIALSLVLVPAVAAFVAVMMIMQGFVFDLLYDGKYAEYGYLIPLLGAAQVLGAATLAPSHALRALNQPRAVFVVAMVAAATTVATVFPFTAWWGLTGAATAVLSGYVVTAPMWAWYYLGAARKIANETVKRET